MWAVSPAAVTVNGSVLPPNWLVRFPVAAVVIVAFLAVRSKHPVADRFRLAGT